MPRITIKAARINANLSLEEAAKLAHVSVKNIQKFEQDSSNIPPDLAVRLSKIYNYPLDYIFLGQA